MLIFVTALTTVLTVVVVFCFISLWNNYRRDKKETEEFVMSQLKEWEQEKAASWMGKRIEIACAEYEEALRGATIMEELEGR